MKQFGYVLVGTAVSRIRIANPNANRLHIESLAQNAFDKDVTILVFPELSLTGSTCGDLFSATTVALRVAKLRQSGETIG